MTLNTFQKGQIDKFMENHSEALFKSLCEKHKVDMDKLEDADVFNLVGEVREINENVPAGTYNKSKASPSSGSETKQAATTTARVIQVPMAPEKKILTPKEKNCLNDFIENIGKSVYVPYIGVDARMIYFSLKYPNGRITIDTQQLTPEKIVFKATLFRDARTEESRQSYFTDCSMIDLSKATNENDFEKVATSAKGRVLISVGVGIIGSPINNEKFSDLATVGVKTNQDKKE